MAHNVIAEGKRCLNCKKPLCRQGCPINTPIPEMISIFLSGDIERAGKIVFENNPLSPVCALVCNYGGQCQGKCIRGINGEPVEISSIEYFVSTYYFDGLEPVKTKSNGIKIAVVGAGPAGITIAIKMAELGYDVTVFEAKPKIGGVLRYGIPDFRLPRTLIDKYETLLRKLGVKLRFNFTVGKTVGIMELFRDGFKAVSIGTGITWPVTLGIRGETLGHVHYGVHFLQNPDVYDLGEKLIVIGAGNVAADVARTALRRGVKDVKIVARSDRYTADEEQKEYAEIEGAQFIFNKAPVEITDEGVMFADTICDKEHKVISVSDHPKLMTADSVMVCVSQRPSDLILTGTPGLERDDRGFAKVNFDGSTTLEGVFASGDVVRGAKTVVEAAATSKRVAFAMDNYLKEKYLNRA